MRMTFLLDCCAYVVFKTFPLVIKVIRWCISYILAKWCMNPLFSTFLSPISCLCRGWIWGMTRQQMSLYESLCPRVTISFLRKYFTNADGNMTVFVRVC